MLAAEGGEVGDAEARGDHAPGRARPRLLLECGPVALGPTGALHAVEGARFAALGRVHTAGTEAAYAWSGYIEGALRAGERVGAEVVAALE